MQKSALKSALSDLDFRPSEVDVYLALMSLGVTSVGALISSTGLHRNVVYTALEHLVARKLISEQQIKGKKTFSLSDPSVLKEEFQDKSEKALEVTQAIQELSSQETQEITVHQGNDEYLTLLTSLIRQQNKASTIYVLGTGGETFMQNTMRPIWKKYHHIAKQQGILVKMISYESQRQAIADDVANEGIYEVRYLSDEIENPAGVHIYSQANTVLNIIYSTDTRPVTAIRIKNCDLVQGQLNLFNNLWQMAKA